MGVVESEYGNHAMPGCRNGTVGYHIDDGRIFDENNPEKGVECEGKCLIHYSMKSDALKVYHVEVNNNNNNNNFICIAVYTKNSISLYNQKKKITN